MSSPYLFLLEALRSQCNLPPFPEPLPSNELTLELENGLSISIDFKEETALILLFAELGTYLPEEEQQVLSSIAQANFLWAATAGATLSARPDIQTVYLAQQFPVSILDRESFIELVEAFIKTGSQWQSFLKEHQWPQEERSASAVPSLTSSLEQEIEKA